MSTNRLETVWQRQPCIQSDEMLCQLGLENFLRVFRMVALLRVGMGTSQMGRRASYAII